MQSNMPLQIGAVNAFIQYFLRLFFFLNIKGKEMHLLWAQQPTETSINRI